MSRAQIGEQLPILRVMDRCRPPRHNPQERPQLPCPRWGRFVLGIEKPACGGREAEFRGNRRREKLKVGIFWRSHRERFFWNTQLLHNFSDETRAQLRALCNQFLRQEVEAAGVKLVDEGKFLRNPNDPRDKNTPDSPATQRTNSCSSSSSRELGMSHLGPGCVKTTLNDMILL